MLVMAVSSKALCIVFRMLYHTRQRKKISICGKESDLCNQTSSRQSSSQSPLFGRSWLPKRNRANFHPFSLFLFFLSSLSCLIFFFPFLPFSRHMYEFQRPANFPAIRYTIVRRINEQRKKQKDTERYLSSTSCPSNGLPSPPVDHDDMFKQEDTTTTTTTTTTTPTPTTLPTSTLVELSGTPSSGNSCASSPRESQHVMDEKAIRDKIQELQNEKHELFQLMKNLLSKQQQQQQQQEIQQQQQQIKMVEDHPLPPPPPSSSSLHSSSSLSISSSRVAPPPPPPVVSTSSTSSSRSSSSERSPSPQTPPVQEQSSQRMPPLTSLSSSSSSSSQHMRSSSLDHHRSFPPHPPPPPRYMPYHRRPPPLAPPRYYSSRYGGNSGGGRPMNGFSSPSYPVSRHDATLHVESYH